MSGGETNLSRRSALVTAVGALSALLVRPAGATSETMQAAIREFSGGAAIKPGRVTMDIPPLVENGNSVPLTITVDSPMTEKDFVKAIAVFNEKNPQPNRHIPPQSAVRPCARFHPHPPRGFAEHCRGGAALRRHALVRFC
jgi:sulfur-oxidizing protein SoxY